MGNKKRRQKRVPEVLWRKYGNKAATLSHTITSLIPPKSKSTTSDCPHCNARKCIACCGKHYLLSPDDPDDYRYLLNHCFVVVSDNAPTLQYSPHSRWPQHQIVWRTVEMIISNEQRAQDQNVLCYGYDKHNHSSTIIRLLTSSTWILLSKRVGDAVMFYLLMWTSVFLPLPCKKYHQVTGFPMSELVFMSPKRMQEPRGSSKKRKRIDVDSTLMRPNLDSSAADAFSSRFTCFGCAGQSYSTPSSWPRTEYHMKTSLHGGETEASVAYANSGRSSIGECPARPTISLPSKRKHSKASRWQRQKKRRLLSLEEAYSICPEVKSPRNKDNHRKRSRQYRWQRHQKHRLVSSREACDLSQCAEVNKDGDLLTDHRKEKTICGMPLPWL